MKFRGSRLSDSTSVEFDERSRCPALVAGERDRARALAEVLWSTRAKAGRYATLLVADHVGAVKAHRTRRSQVGGNPSRRHFDRLPYEERPSLLARGLRAISGGVGLFAATDAMLARPLRGPTGAFNATAVLMTLATPPVPRAIPTPAVQRVEIARSPARGTTPEQLQEILRRRSINGDLGELIVIERERHRLRAAGLAALAAEVSHVARHDVTLGYDIHSFESDGAAKFIEVKATSGTGLSFEMTENEWRTARNLRGRYVIARVTRVRGPQPEIHELRDPVRLLDLGSLSRVPISYRVNY